MTRSLVFCILSVLLSTALPAEEVIEARGPAVLRAASAALVLSGQVGGAVPLDLLVLPGAAEAAAGHDEVNVVVLMEVNGEALAERLATAPLTAEIFLYVLAPENGAVRAQASQSIELSGKHIEALQVGGLRLAMPLRVPAGKHEARLLVRLSDDAFGLRHANVDTDSPVPPAILSPAGLRVEGKAWPSVENWALAAEANQGADEVPVWPPPERLPVIPVATPEQALAEISGDASRAPRPELIATYLRALGRQAAGERQEALRQLYELETKMTGERVEPLSLERLSRLEGVTTGEIVRGGQQRSVGGAPYRKGAPRAVLPIALLHADAADGYRAAERFRLAIHSEEVVLGLAAFLGNKGEASQESTEKASVQDEAASRQAARLLSSLAGRLLERGIVTRAESILRRALVYDENNIGALLALAAIEDRRGRTGAALRHLERLAAVDPDHAEANLLRAVCFLHSENVDAALPLLRKVCAGDDWTAVVGCGEAARQRALRDDFEGALAEVEKALARWPEHPTLTLQKAYLLDRLGRSGEALEEVRIMDRSTRKPNERGRFNDWPLADINADREALRREAEAAWPELARAVTALRREVER